MYAHQVVDFLKKNYWSYPHAKMLVQEIQNSIHFYIGEAVQIFDMFVKGPDWYDNLFYGDYYGKDLRMPYPKCCFIFWNAHGGRAEVFYVQEFNNGDSLFVRKWTKGNPGGIWEWSLFGSEIIIENILSPWEKTKISARNRIEENEGIYLPFSDNGFLNYDQAELRAHCCRLNFALMLLNCRNIETIDNPPPEKLNKKRRKKNKPPLFSYYTLEVIKPGQQTVSEPGRVSEDTVRLHFCRGHFRYYTEDKPLFGKHVGRFWIQPHVKGDKKKGVVAKDYSVKIS